MADQKTTRVYLVRHGATMLSAEDRFAGAVDVELSDEGKFQAGRLAERLADDPLAAVYSSPMKRTLETAAILADSAASRRTSTTFTSASRRSKTASTPSFWPGWARASSRSPAGSSA